MKSRVSASSLSPKTKNSSSRTSNGLIDSPCFDAGAHDQDLKNSMDGYVGIIHNHIYQAALKYQRHPKMRTFYKKRIPTAHEDPEFLRDLFNLAMELDREAFNALLKNRE